MIFFGFSKETQEERNQKPLDEACIPQKQLASYAA
jgi:hypothetical protein